MNLISSLKAEFHGLGIDHVKQLVRFRVTAAVVLLNQTRPTGLELALYLNGICIAIKKTDKFGVVIFDLKVPFDKVRMENRYTRNEFAVRSAKSIAEGVGFFYCQEGHHPTLPLT